MPDNDEVIVSINGTNYGGWKSANVTSSMEFVCGSFDVNLMDKCGELDVPHEIKPGDGCQVLLGDDPVITGYVDDVSPSISASDHQISISGRDKTCDLVDCSVDLTSFEVIGVTLADLANMVCAPFGISVKVKTDCGEPFVRFAVQVGETAFSCLERAARQRGVLLTTDCSGALVITAKNEFEACGDALIEGVNIKSGSASFNWRERFKEYTCHGQMPAFFDGADDPIHNQIGKATDCNVKRYRPMLITGESFVTCDAARIRAENECGCRAGKSTQVRIEVVGWRQSSGQLWRPRQKVSVQSNSLYLDNAELVIATVRYGFSDFGGKTVDLELNRPDAFLESGSGQVESDP